MIRILQEARGRVSGDGVELAFGYSPGRGAPVVALHGITANHVGFIGIAERLAGRRPLFALDLRGRGDSDKPATGYGMAQHARDVAAAMRAMGLGPSLIIGHSMGGFVATALAAQDAELVSGLLLIDGGLAIKPSGDAPANEHVRAALAERINQLVRTYESREAYRAFWKAQPTFPAADWSPWIEAFLDYEVGRADAGRNSVVKPKALQAAVIADLKEGVNTQEILNRARGLPVPVTLVRAETGFTNTQPPLYPDSIMEEVRSYTPNLQDRKIEGATHYTVLLGHRGASEIADLIADFS